MYTFSRVGVVTNRGQGVHFQKGGCGDQQRVRCTVSVGWVW